MTTTEPFIRQPTPLETLTSIGFTRKEANTFLNRIENSYTTQPSKIVRYRQQRWGTFSLKKLLPVVWGYTFLVWLYVIAMQLRFPDSVYWPLSVWLPIRMDYLGEIAFVFSFILASSIAIWHTRSTPTKLTTPT